MVNPNTKRKIPFFCIFFLHLVNKYDKKLVLIQKARYYRTQFATVAQLVRAPP